MNPKNHKVFKKEIADEVGVHENVVDDFVAFYYSKVRKALSSLEHPSILVDGLGTFKIRKARLEKSIKSSKSKLGDLCNNTYKGYERKVALEDKISKMEILMDNINENIEKKKQFKNKRNGTE